MATAWSATYLDELGRINPEGHNPVVIKRNSETIILLLRQLVTALDEGIEAAIDSGAINTGTDGCYAMTWMGF